VLLWLLTIPFQKGPDEAAHFQVVRFILDHGRLPAFHPDELWLIKVPIGVVETYATFPPLAYLFAAAASAPLRDAAMWISRLTSAAAYVGTVALTFLIARHLFPGSRQIALIAAVIVAFLPQFAFTGAYVNNDALATLLSAAVMWLLVRLCWERPAARDLLALGAMAGALMVTKYTGYPVAAVAVLAPLVPAMRDPRETVRRGAMLGLAAATTSGWWFARNWMLYRELIPGEVVAEAKEQAGGNSLFVPVDHGLNLLTVNTGTEFWSLTLRSFVGVFGFLDVVMDPWHYWLAGALAVVGGVGVTARLAAGPIRRELRIAAVIGTAILGLTAFAAVAISTFGEYSPQGRYLFGALVPFAIALAAGWTWLGRQHAVLRAVPLCATGCVIGLNLTALLVYIVPSHYGGASQSVVVQIDQPSRPQARDSGIEIMGWSIVQGGEQWRPFTPDVVSEYRRSVNGVMIYLDGPPGVGQFQGTARYGFRRLDVSNMYGGAPPIERVGFRMVLRPGSVSPGKHRIFACATIPSSATPVCSNREFEVA
jgi:4-amino-4-deoxy-L-arabinose transferase-like glycosyltransferase